MGRVIVHFFYYALKTFSFDFLSWFIYVFFVVVFISLFNPLYLKRKQHVDNSFRGEKGHKNHISWSVELITEKKKNRSRYIFKVWQ